MRIEDDSVLLVVRYVEYSMRHHKERCYRGDGGGNGGSGGRDDDGVGCCWWHECSCPLSTPIPAMGMPRSTPEYLRRINR